MYGNVVGRESMWDTTSHLSAAAQGPPNRVTEERFMKDVGVAASFTQPNPTSVMPPDASGLMNPMTRTRESVGEIIDANMRVAAQISGPKRPPIEPSEEVLAASTPHVMAGYMRDKSAYIEPKDGGYGPRPHQGGMNFAPPGHTPAIPYMADHGPDINVSDYSRSDYRVDTDRYLSQLL